MSSASEHDVHQCLNCLKGATHTCKGCKAMPNATDGQISSAWYCGAECQKAHWTEHKTQCKAAQARQALYRAGAMLQQIFYLYSKITFTWSPGPVEKIGTTWLIHTSEYTGTSHLMPFPYAMVPDVQDQEALLTYQSCSSAVSQMHNVVNVFLRGLYSKIDEVSHFVKGAKHHLKRVYTKKGLTSVDSTDYAHTIIRVTMKNGETYAVDMSGAQYGWHECITPWQSYNSSKVRKIRDVSPFGRTKVFCKMRADNMGTQQQWIHGMQENFTRCMNDVVAAWQMSNIPCADLFRLPEHDFQHRQASLLYCVDELLQRYKAFQASNGAFDVSGGFTHEGYDRAFTSAARGVISQDGSISSTPAFLLDDLNGNL